MKSRTIVHPGSDEGAVVNRVSLACFALILWVLLALVTNVAAQQDDKPTAPVQQTSGPPSSNDIGPSADSIRPYSPVGRDPFRRFVVPKAVRDPKKAEKMKLLGFPALATRRVEFQQKVQAAQDRNLPEPDPVGQYLVSELEVTGIFRDGRGHGAFVRALPTGTTFYVRGGARCYNGEVLRIESDESEDGSRVLFREISILEQGGKQTQQERVLAKTPVRAAGRTRGSR